MKFINYLKDTRGELKHVSWPTQRQTAAFTILVILISLFTAFFLGFFDFIFTSFLDFFFFSDSGSSAVTVPTNGNTEIIQPSGTEETVDSSNNPGTIPPLGDII